MTTRIVIIGGGPAGYEAALVAAGRGRGAWTHAAPQTTDREAAGKTVPLVCLGKIPDVMASVDPGRRKFHEGLDNLCGPPVWFRTCYTHVQLDGLETR